MILSIVLFLVSSYHLFDAGPKPSMKFRLIYETSQSIEIEKGYQLESKFADFSQFDTLAKQGPQRFQCSDTNTCFSMAYGYDEYNKLVLIFNDKERTSNIFSTKAYNSSFDVLVKDDSLEVIETTSFLKRGDHVYNFLKALILTLLIEMTGALFLFMIFKIPRFLLWTLFAANLISLPLVWFVFPLIGNIIAAIILAEIFAVIFEAYFMNIMSKKIITIGKAFTISIIVNLCSFLAGILLYMLLFFV